MTKGGARSRLFFPGKARKRRYALLNATKPKVSFKVSASKGKKVNKPKKLEKAKKETKKSNRSQKGTKNNKTSRVSVQTKPKRGIVKKKPLRSVSTRKCPAKSSERISTYRAAEQTAEETVDEKKWIAGEPPCDVLIDPQSALDDTVANDCPSKGFSTSAMTDLVQQELVHASEDSAPLPSDNSSLHVRAETRWYRVAAPLLPTRVRELFDHRGFAATSDSADAAALACLFPLTHNSEWFNGPDEFVEHCKSISHRLLCESAPCFPMDPLPHKWIKPIVSSSPCETDYSEYTHDECDDFSDNKELSRVRDMWFMRLHAVAMHFFAREWNSFLLHHTAGHAYIAELQQSMSAFHSAAAEAVARQIAQECGDGSGDQVPERWLSLKETVPTVETTLRRVYVSRRDSPIALSEMESKEIRALATEVAATVVESLHYAQDMFVEPDDRETCAMSEGTEVPILQFKEDCEESQISQLTLWLFMKSHASQ